MIELFVETRPSYGSCWELLEIENRVNLSAFKVKLQVVKTKVSPRLDLISAPACPTTSQAEKGGSTHMKLSLHRM